MPTEMNYPKLVSLAQSAIAELEILHAKTPAVVRHCPHTKAPPAMRILIDENFLQVVTEDTLITFSILTAVDQALYFAARPLSRVFKKLYPTLPLPMVLIGYGCVRVIDPQELIKIYYSYLKTPESVRRRFFKSYRI